jgi:DNA-binding transcriptional LysR family regulator
VPNVVMEVEAIETAKRMVERGLGLAFLPHLAVSREIRDRKLLALDVVDAEPVRRSLDVIHPRQRPLGAEARALLQVFRAAVRAVVIPAARRRPPRQGAGRPPRSRTGLPSRPAPGASRHS